MRFVLCLIVLIFIESVPVSANLNMSLRHSFCSQLEPAYNEILLQTKHDTYREVIAKALSRHDLVRYQANDDVFVTPEDVGIMIRSLVAERDPLMFVSELVLDMEYALNEGHCYYKPLAIQWWPQDH